MEFLIKENKNTLKSKEKYLKDEYFNLLIEYAIKYHKCNDIHKIIKNLFDLYSLDDYKFFFENYLLHNEKYNVFYYNIYELFCEWKPYEYYNMGNCKGAFLEEFTYNLLKKVYSDANIYKESCIIKDDYSSHNWDIVLIFDDSCKSIECKFSSYNIQEKHINQIKGFKNKFKNFDVYLVSYDYKDIFLDKLNIITKNNLKELLENINIIPIEDLIKENPFDL